MRKEYNLGTIERISNRRYRIRRDFEKMWEKDNYFVFNFNVDLITGDGVDDYEYISSKKVKDLFPNVDDDRSLLKYIYEESKLEMSDKFPRIYFSEEEGGLLHYINVEIEKDKNKIREVTEFVINEIINTIKKLEKINKLNEMRNWVYDPMDIYFNF